MSWTEQPIHFVDFEGGVGCGVLEYGVATLHRGAVVALATRVCAPTGRVRAEESALHGLDAAALAGAQPFAEEFARFAALRESGPLAAHFAGAEHGMLRATWPYPRAAPDFTGRSADGTVAWGPWIDTGQLALTVWPGLTSARLSDVIAGLGLQTTLAAAAAQWCPVVRRRYHAAPYDALAGALILARLATEPTAVTWPLAQLFFLSTANPERREALSQGELF
jgi:DNA polymerase III epsilon subunit-like protein